MNWPPKAMHDFGQPQNLKLFNLEGGHPKTSSRQMTRDDFRFRCGTIPERLPTIITSMFPVCGNRELPWYDLKPCGALSLYSAMAQQ